MTLDTTNGGVVSDAFEASSVATTIAPIQQQQRCPFEDMDPVVAKRMKEIRKQQQQM